MQFLFFGTPAWQLIMQSDWMTKLVLIGLLIASILCIAVIMSKYLQIRSMRRQVADFARRAGTARSYTQLLQCAHDQPHNMVAELVLEMHRELQALRGEGDAAHQVILASRGHALTEHDFEHFSMINDQIIARVMANAETNLPMLGISGAVAPLVGLFGTVWGLIHSFISISQEKSADISVVAPGIAEALITTLAGLVVAVPAMIFFHYFSNELRKTEQDLMGVVDRLQTLAHRAHGTAGGV